MVGQGRLELPTSRLSSARSNQLSYWPAHHTSSPTHPSLPTQCGVGGGGRVRTDDLRLAKPPLSQLSYAPISRHADTRADHRAGPASRGLDREGMRRRRSRGHGRVSYHDDRSSRTLRKEVIQPQVPLRLPCYDFTPVADLTVAGCLLAVSAPSSGKTNSHGVTGGVYKARERIHRGMLIHDY